MFKNPIWRVWLACVVTLAAGLPAALPATAAAHHRHHHHHTRHRGQLNGGGIPQHNGGDRDADNNGGPSDGDGNV